VSDDQDNIGYVEGIFQRQDHFEGFVATQVPNQLKANNENAISSITAGTLTRVSRSMRKSIAACTENAGGLFQHVL
jgi:hypothetical protein